MYNYWTQQDLDIMYSFFPCCSDEKIADILGRSIQSVQNKARRLGLKKNSQYLFQVQQKLAINIRSGSHRHQFKKGGDPDIFYGTGLDHPNYIKDRSLLKGRRKKDEFTIHIRNRVKQQQKNHCAKCGCNLSRTRYEFDHIVPIFAGGKPELTNCQLLCWSCHRLKTKQEQIMTNNFNCQENYSFLARTVV